jgi:hypothetical protein
MGETVFWLRLLYQLGLLCFFSFYFWIGEASPKNYNNFRANFHPLGDFSSDTQQSSRRVDTILTLLGQGLKKSPIGQKLAFVNHPYLCKGL